ncbi:MAG: response regulator transcription factor [Alphaproteobacteria bacterium]|nr:response regulator transcription factor [Alphaproteobacteria bacterium SS10]
MRILVVEDEEALANQLSTALGEAGFTVDIAADGEEGAHLGESENYHAIVLDLGLPKLDGVSVLKRWRSADNKIPVLILTARGSWQDRVEGLNAGGDDYVAKPFQMEEVVARLRALIRRSSGLAGTELTAGAVVLNTVNATVTLNGQAVTLTSHEYKLLMTLMIRPDHVHGKADLAEQLYGLYEDRDSNTIEVFVGRLRRKLGTGIIETVRGLGYRIGTA